MQRGQHGCEMNGMSEASGTESHLRLFFSSASFSFCAVMRHSSSRTTWAIEGRMLGSVVHIASTSSTISSPLRAHQQLLTESTRETHH